MRDWATLDLRSVSSRDRALVIGGAVASLVLAFFGAYFVYHRFGAPANQYDLKIYYNALTDWRAGSGLYSYAQWDVNNGILGFTYPPVAAILMSPMTRFSLHQVVTLSTVAIFAATVGVVVLSVRERIALRGPQLALLTGLATAGAFCLQPISQTAAYGQVNTFLALLVLADVLVLARRKSKWAGVAIGLAMAIKLTPAIFLLYLALSGRWRMLRTAVVTAAGATVLAAACAPAATWQYFTSLLWDSGRVGVLDNTANQSINGTLARLVSPLPPDKLTWMGCAALLVVIGSFRIRAAVLAGDHLSATTVTGLLGVLVSPVSWLHHAVWIVPAMVVLVARLIVTFPLRLVRSLSAGLSRTPLSRFDRQDARSWLGVAALTVSGLLVFVLNTRNTFGLPDVDYSNLGVGAALAGSVQTLWMIAAVVLLPVHGLAAGVHNPIRAFLRAAPR